MITITVRLYEELNDVLPIEKRKRAFTRTLSKGSSVSDLLSDLGIPVEQVELAVVNGRSERPSYIFRNNDQISLFPVFESIDVTPLLRFRDAPLRSLKFLTDGTVGKLGEALAGRGYDVRLEPDMDDLELVEVAEREGRILLSIRARLVRNAGATRALRVPEGDPEVQLTHLLARLDLG